MKNTFFLREEFIEWLVNVCKFPLKSAQSYCSYVAGIDKAFIFSEDGTENEVCFFKMVENEVNKYSDDNFFGLGQFIVSVINELSLDKIEERLEKPLSTIRNWRSALYQYQEFVYDFAEKKIGVERIENPNEKVIESEDRFDNSWSDDITFATKEDYDQLYLSLKLRAINKQEGKTRFLYIYTKQDLYKNFRFRIITQDRFYNQIFFPISFIKRFFYLREEKLFFDEWIANLLDNVNIHLQDQTIKLCQISRLEITSSGTFAICNDISNAVFTRKSDNLTLVPFSVNELRRIALDHEKPLQVVMYENLDNLKTLQKITIELKKFISGTVNPKKFKIASNEVLNSHFLDSIKIENLKKEMEFISSLTNLQLMDGKENLLKKVHDAL